MTHLKAVHVFLAIVSVTIAFSVSEPRDRRRKEACQTMPYDVDCHGVCPVVDWEATEQYWNNKICTDKLTFHCAKNESVQSEQVIAACAAVVYCERGKEPIIKPVRGHPKNASIECSYCPDDSFNPRMSTPSNKNIAPWCWKKQRCDKDNGQVPCDVVGGDEKYWTNTKCTCDARKGFRPKNNITCDTSDNILCSNGHYCNATQVLLLNFSCGPPCQDGYNRTSISDECVLSNQTLGMNATSTTTENPMKSHAETTAHSSNSTIQTATNESGPTDAKEGVAIVVIAGIIIGVAIVVIAGIIIVCVVILVIYKNRKPQGYRRPTEQDSPNELQSNSSHGIHRAEVLEIAVSNIEPSQEAVSSSGNIGTESNEVVPNTEHSEPEESSSGNRGTEIPNEVVPNTEHSEPEEPTDLSRKEKESIISRNCTEFLVMDPSNVIDRIQKKELLLSYEITDLRDKIKTSDRSDVNRRILQYVTTQRIDYHDFKKVLKSALEKQLVKILNETEKTVIAKRDQKPLAAPKNDRDEMPNGDADSVQESSL